MLPYDIAGWQVLQFGAPGIIILIRARLETGRIIIIIIGLKYMNLLQILC